LNQNGHDAWLYNADFLSQKLYANLRQLFNGFVDYKSFFDNKDADIWEEVVDKIIEFEPDWV